MGFNPEGYSGFGGGDDEFSFDFSGVERRSDYIPEGEYLMQVKDIKNGTANTGNEQVIWRLEVAEGDQEGSVIDYKITKVPAAMKVMSGIVAAIGLGKPGQRDVRFKRGDAIGRMLRAVIVDDSYTDKNGEKVVSSKVKYVRPAGK
jgi:hypothetical protein